MHLKEFMISRPEKLQLVALKRWNQQSALVTDKNILSHMLLETRCYHTLFDFCLVMRPHSGYVGRMLHELLPDSKSSRRITESSNSS